MVCNHPFREERATGARPPRALRPRVVTIERSRSTERIQRARSAASPGQARQPRVAEGLSQSTDLRRDHQACPRNHVFHGGEGPAVSFPHRGHHDDVDLVQRFSERRSLQEPNEFEHDRKGPASPDHGLKIGALRTIPDQVQFELEFFLFAKSRRARSNTGQEPFFWHQAADVGQKRRWSWVSGASATGISCRPVIFHSMIDNARTRERDSSRERAGRRRCCGAAPLERNVSRKHEQQTGRNSEAKTFPRSGSERISGSVLPGSGPDKSLRLAEALASHLDRWTGSRDVPERKGLREKPRQEKR